VIALFSGLTGGFIANRFNSAQPVTNRDPQLGAGRGPLVGGRRGRQGPAERGGHHHRLRRGLRGGLSADGAILTNNHVLEGAQGNTVKVTFSTARRPTRRSSAPTRAATSP
jgi:hypothetical protein